MKRTILITALLLCSCIQYPEQNNSTPITVNIATPLIESKITLTPISEECSQSNPALANWLRETTPADTLTLTALQMAGDLYSNPRDTGKQEALDWQQRTMQAYDFMKEYQSVPQCLVTYHNFVTETLLQLSMTFSELELVYVAADTNQDYEPHLNAAEEFLSAALEASKASVNEWDRLKSLGLIPNESNSLILTPTYAPSSASSNDNSCTKEKVTSYLEDVDTTMTRATKLANDFGQTQNREEAVSIAKEVENMFIDINLWEVPDCAAETQLSLLLVIVNIKIMQQDIIRNDLTSFHSDYKEYENAVEQLNSGRLKLIESVK